MSLIENYSKINVVALSTDNSSAVELLKKCFSGLTCSSDCNNCTFSFDGISLELFTKYPNDDLLKKKPEFLDFILISVPEGHDLENEILDYANSKLDARGRFLVDGGDRKVPSLIKSLGVDSVIIEIKEFDKDLKTFLTDSADQSEQRSVFVNRKQLGNKINYLQDTNFALLNVNMFPKLQAMMKSFENFDLNRGYSENTIKFDFSPTNDESNGIGLRLNLIAGENFDESNKVLPLSVRDNLLTASVELKAKSPEHANEALSFLKNCLDLLENMGLIDKLREKFNFSVSFSKDGSSVFIDFVFGGNLGEAIIHKIRSLNFSKFNYSFSDVIRLQTNLNITEIWKNPDLENIINKLSAFTIQGEGKLLNFRTIFYFIREWLVYAKSDSDKKGTHLVVAGLLILSCFESLGFDLKYDSKDLKGNVIELIDEYLEGEGSSQAFIGIVNEQWANTYVPMFLSTLQSITPMITSLGNLSVLNFDLISVELLAPFARVELKLDLILPGLTDFVSENILS